MKLLEKSSYYYLVYTLFIFSVGTVLFYFLIKKVLIDSIDEALHQEKTQIIENLKYELNFQDLKPSENVEIRVSALKKIVPDHYQTILLKDSLENNIHYRELNSVYFHDENYYQIIIRQSMAEADDLVQGILPVVIFLFLLILIGVVFINRHISSQLWSTFYILMEKLKTYNLAKTGIISRIHTDIDEFSALGESIEKMTSKIYNDYLSQKEFNENSSHELQTPLAIIRNKLEVLIQSKNLDGKDMEIIESIFEAVKRLNQLNKGLLLLSKIDNQQYETDEKINIKKIILQSLIYYDEQIEEKRINVHTDIPLEDVMVEGNLVLIETLFNNLLSNSIRHNNYKGEIYITLTQSDLKISNTGPLLLSSPSLMFERFKKQSNSEYSIGLGLSIVKKICDTFHYKINYSYYENNHEIYITF